LAIIVAVRDSIAVRAMPPGDAAELDQLLSRQSHALATSQARRFFTRAAIRHRLNSGRWESPARGVYVVRPMSDSAQQRRWVAVLAGPAGAVTSGRTALEQHGLRGFETRAIHLLIRHTSHPGAAPNGVVHHLTRNLPAAQVQEWSSPPRTVAARALLDAAQWARSDNEARTIIAATLQQRLVLAAQVHTVLMEMTAIHRRPVIVTALSDAAAGAHSLPEMEFLALCRTGRLPTPTLQHRRKDARGRQWVLDGLFEEYRVHVEIDGSHHMDVRQFWADMQRQNELWVAGERVLRFPSWVVRNRPAEVIATLTAALRAAGWPG
jgi:very-short-patch-repair endonuclease